MKHRVTVNPELYFWARHRSERTDIYKKFPKLKDWEAGRLKPTLKQLESFAEYTWVPIGYLFLDKPPIEDLSMIKNLHINRGFDLRESK